MFYSRSRDQENIERFPKLMLSLKQVTTGMKSFLEAIEHNLDLEKVIKLQTSLNQIR